LRYDDRYGSHVLAFIKRPDHRHHDVRGVMDSIIIAPGLHGYCQTPSPSIAVSPLIAAAAAAAAARAYLALQRLHLKCCQLLSIGRIRRVLFKPTSY